MNEEYQKHFSLHQTCTAVKAVLSEEKYVSRQKELKPSRHWKITMFFALG